MKKLTLLAFLLVTLFCKAQETRNVIAINYGTGNGSVGQLGKVDGGGHKEVQSLNTIGISYLERMSKNLYFETGLQYLVCKYTSWPGVAPPEFNFSTDHLVKLIGVPIKLRYEAGKYIFFNTGLYVDIDVSEKAIYSSQKFSGLGASAGIGLQYYFKNKLGLYVNPMLDFRNLLTISSGSNKLVSGNLVFGLAYRIK